MRDLDSDVFRQLCGRFPTGVTVVTTRSLAGRPVGMTANSFTSVSLVPPLVSVNVDRQAEMHGHLSEARRFVVNILGLEQEALSRRFAGDHADKFEGVGFRETGQGMPVLDGVLAWFECEPHAAFPAGDHTIFVGRVVDGGAREGHPLYYYRGGYLDTPAR